MRKICITVMLMALSGISLAQEAPYQMARTKGLLPFLEYGPGDDRLGGAKMTYLDSGILVKVVDSLNSDYIIALTDNLKAFIAKSSVQFEPSLKAKPYYLSGNWKTYREERFDVITIAMPERLPYRSIMQVNPNRLIIDLFGITSNTNWITQKGQTSELRNTWFEQMESGMLRVYVDLKSSLHWGHSVHYDSVASRLIIKVKHAPDKKIQNLFRNWKRQKIKRR